MTKNSYATASIPSTYPDLTPSSAGPRAHNHLLAKLGPEHPVTRRVSAISDEIATNIIETDGAHAAYGSALERRALARENVARVLSQEHPDAALLASMRARVTHADAGLESFEHTNTERIRRAEGLKIISNNIPPVLAEFWKPGEARKPGVNVIMGYIELGGEAQMIPLADEPKITMPRDGWNALVNEKRAEIIGLRRERGRTVHVPLEEALRSATRHINTLANAAQPVWNGKKIVWPTSTINAEPNRFSTNQDRVRVIDTEALVARFFRDQVIADVEKSIRSHYEDELDGEVILDANGARVRLRDIDAKIALAETIECHAFWKGRESGEDIAWRPDVNIKRLLGIAA